VGWERGLRLIRLRYRVGEQMDLFWQVAGEGSVAVEGWDYRQAIIIVAFYFLQFNLIFFPFASYLRVSFSQLAESRFRRGGTSRVGGGQGGG